MIERLPILVHPGFDCRGDNANCTSCNERRKRGLGRQDHGRSGGRAWYGVATTLADGTRAALTLEVLLCKFPPSVFMTDEMKRACGVDRPRGATLAFHLQNDDGGECCAWLRSPIPGEAQKRIEPGDRWSSVPDAKCSAAVLSYVRAQDIVFALFNPNPDAEPDDQIEPFWTCLERELRDVLAL